MLVRDAQRDAGQFTKILGLQSQGADRIVAMRVETGGEQDQLWANFLSEVV